MASFKSTKADSFIKVGSILLAETTHTLFTHMKMFISILNPMISMQDQEQNQGITNGESGVLNGIIILANTVDRLKIYVFTILNHIKTFQI